MTATQTQKKFQRIDVADLERLMLMEAQSAHEEPVHKGFIGFIKSMLDKYIF